MQRRVGQLRPDLECDPRRGSLVRHHELKSAHRGGISGDRAPAPKQGPECSPLVGAAARPDAVRIRFHDARRDGARRRDDARVPRQHHQDRRVPPTRPSVHHSHGDAHLPLILDVPHGARADQGESGGAPGVRGETGLRSGPPDDLHVHPGTRSCGADGEQRCGPQGVLPRADGIGPAAAQGAEQRNESDEAGGHQPSSGETTRVPGVIHARTRSRGWKGGTNRLPATIANSGGAQPIKLDRVRTRPEPVGHLGPPSGRVTDEPRTNCGMERTGIEPVTSWLQTRRSPS